MFDDEQTIFLVLNGDKVLGSFSVSIWSSDLNYSKIYALEEGTGLKIVHIDPKAVVPGYNLEWEIKKLLREVEKFPEYYGITPPKKDEPMEKDKEESPLENLPTPKKPDWLVTVSRLDGILCGWEHDYSPDADERAVKSIWAVLNDAKRNGLDLEWN